MTVKELRKLLRKCDPNATIRVEAFRGSEAKVVKSYKRFCGKNFCGDYVFIADTTERIDAKSNS